MKSKSVITATVGFMCLALANWMASMPSAGWFERIYEPGVAIMYPLAIILGVIGILAFVHDRTLDSIIFFGGSGLFWSAHLSMIAATNDPGSYVGWYFFVWFVFFCYVWFGSFKAGLPRFLFLLGQWLTLLALAIGNWGGAHLHIITRIGGYLGLITAILAAITSASTVIRNGFSATGPNNDSHTVAA